MNVCSRCLRLARKQARVDHLAQAQYQNIPVRYLHTTISRSQQSQAQTQIKRPQQPPPPLPTTAPTVTTNIAADQVKSGTAKTSAEDASTPSAAQMQRVISSNLRPKPLTMKLASALRSVAKSTTETYIVYGLTEAMVQSCSAQAEYTVPEDQRMGIYTGKGPPKNSGGEDVGIPAIDPKTKLGRGSKSWWFTEMGLEPTFSTWSQVTFLHMYIVTVKLRTLETDKQYLDYQRYLSEHFSSMAEDKMTLLHGMNARSVRNKYLKDLFMQWRGVLYAYDEGLVKGDAVLASAIWRNLWKADEHVDWEKVAMVVAYMRRTIAAIDEVSIQEMGAGLKNSSLFWENAQHGLLEEVQQKSVGSGEPLTE